MSAVVSVALNGVYPRAVVTSDEDREKIADRALVPFLFKVNTLVFAAASEKAIDETKLFAFVVSVKLELIVKDVAVEDREIFDPATKLVGPNGVYPRAVVIVKGVRLKETGKVVPSFLAIEKLYAMFCEAMLVDRPNELMNLSAAVSVACNGVYPRAVVIVAGVKYVEARITMLSLLPSEKFNSRF